MATSRSNVTRLRVGILPASGVYTMDTQDRFANEYMIRRVSAEAYSAKAGSLVLQESDNADMSAPTTLQTVAVSAAVAARMPWTNLTKKYYRLVYTNDVVAQTVMMDLFIERSGRPLGDVMLTSSAGTEIGTASAPVRTDPTGSTAQPMTIVDGGHVTFGAKADVAATTDTGTFTFMAFVKRLLSVGSALRTLAKGATLAGNPTSTAVDADTQAVDIVVKGTLPAFAAIPAVQIDQTTPGSTNLVQVGGTLPAYAAIPAVKIDQTTPGSTNLVQIGGTLPAFAATPNVAVTSMPGVVGTVAHGAGDSGNPVKVAGKATAALPAAVDEDDRANISVTLYGQQRVVSAGEVAHGAANTANPVLTGFVAESTTPAAVDDGDISQLAGTLYGAAFVNPVTSAGVQVTGATGAAVPAGAVQMGALKGANLGVPLLWPFANTDGVAVSNDLLAVWAALAGYNPTSGLMDRVRTVGTGQLRGTLYDAGGNAIDAGSPSDGGTASSLFGVNALGRLFNGINNDRERNNLESSLLTSAERTTTAESAVQTNYNHQGVKVNLDVTAKVAATTLTIKILMKDANGDYVVYAQSSAFAAAAGSTYSCTFRPGVLTADYAADHEAKNVDVPRSYKVQAVPGDANGVTYSMSQAQEL